MLEKILQELQDTWGYSSEELQDIKDKIVAFSYCCLVDSAVRNELHALDHENDF